MEYTNEQKNILATATKMEINETMKINACAGSGKTFILMELMKAHPEKTFLYIVFNKSMQEEAEKKIVYNNVRVRTSHALAKQELGIGRIVNRHELADYCEFLHKNVKTLRNEKFSERLKNFCASDLVNSNDNDIETVFQSLRIGKLIYTHDLYLKEYQIQLALGRIKLDKYDYVLLDEAQDTTETVYNIFQMANARKIMVGDVNQNIYSFRKTINVLKEPTDYTAHLTTCFRCKQDILDKAYELLTDAGHKTDKMVSGFNESILDGSKAILCRTNNSIFEILSKVIKEDREDSIRIEKDPKQYLAETVDLYYFRTNQKEKALETKNIANFEKILKQYKIKNIDQYFDDGFCDDFNLKSAYEIVIQRKEEVVEIYNAACHIFRNKDNLNHRVSLTTCHLAKGREWDSVIIYSDMDLERPAKILHYKLIAIDELKKATESEKKRRRAEAQKQFLVDQVNEVNLYYVSITRAKKELLDYSAQASDEKINQRMKTADKAIAEFLNIAEPDAEEEAPKNEKTEKAVEKVKDKEVVGNKVEKIANKGKKAFPTYIPIPLFEKFNAINEAYGISNNASINILIKDYVIQKQGILDNI